MQPTTSILWMVTCAAAGCGGSTASSPTDAGVDAAPRPAFSDLLTVTDVVLNQAVATRLVADGAAVAPNAPVVASRAGMVRVFVKPAKLWKARKVDATLHLTLDGAEVGVLTDQRLISGASKSEVVSSTFNFRLTAEQVQPGTSFTVVLHDSLLPADQPDAKLTFPGDGADPIPFGARKGTENVKLRLVPVRYDTDGSGRLPSTTTQQLQRYRDTVFKMYPTANVDLTVREAMPWSQAIDPDGTGWDEVLNALIDLRVQDKAPADVFYIGAFQPAASLQEFCMQGGCVLGIAPLAGPMDIAERVALIEGFAGQRGPNTLNQELAHAMGRAHAPCGGAGGPDPKFPYPEAGIGDWGYDILGDNFIDPSAYFDFMGYCEPIWISDYTFSALFTRIAFISQANVVGSKGPRPFQSFLVDPKGAPRFGRRMTFTAMDPAPGGPTVSYLASDGHVIATVSGNYLPYDSVAGGMLFAPEPDQPFARVRIEGLSAKGGVELKRP